MWKGGRGPEVQKQSKLNINYDLLDAYIYANLFIAFFHFVTFMYASTLVANLRGVGTSTLSATNFYKLHPINVTWMSGSC